MLQRVGETVDPKDAVVKIKDACFPAPFASELEYNSPVHGKRFKSMSVRITVCAVLC